MLLDGEAIKKSLSCVENGMATGSIKNYMSGNFSIESTSHNITWNSLTNPFEESSFSVAKTGKKAIALLGWFSGGSGGTAIFYPRLLLDPNIQTVYYTVRRTNNPDTTTGNTLGVYCLYIPN